MKRNRDSEDDSSSDSDEHDTKRARTGGLGVDADNTLEGVDMVNKQYGVLKTLFTANINKREAHEDDPNKFMESELELDEQIAEFKIASTVPESYTTLVKHGVVDVLMQLLDHENLDIVSSTVDLLKELTDTDAIEECASSVCLPAKLAEYNVLKYLLLIIDRVMVGGGITDIEEQEESCYNTLLVIDNIIENAPEAIWGTEESENGDKNRGQTEDLVAYLLRNLLSTPGAQGVKFLLVRNLSAEVLSNLLQISPKLAAHFATFFVHKNGLLPQVDTTTGRADYTNQEQSSDNINGVFCILKCLSAYIKVPEADVSETEIEYVENLFDSLCACLLHEEGKNAFNKGTGVKLLLKLVLPKKRKRSKRVDKDKEAANTKRLAYTLKHAGLRAFAASLQDNPDGCQAFFNEEEVSALGVVSSFLMLALKKGGSDAQNTLESGVVGIFHELFQHASTSSTQMQRLAAKFVEASHEKTDRMVELLVKHAKRLAAFERRAAKQREYVNEAFRMTEAEEEADRLGSGMLVVSQVSLILAQLCVFEPRLLKHVQQQLAMDNFSLQNIADELSAASTGVDTPDAPPPTKFQSWAVKLKKGFTSLL